MCRVAEDSYKSLLGNFWNLGCNHNSVRHMIPNLNNMWWCINHFRRCTKQFCSFYANDDFLATDKDSLTDARLDDEVLLIKIARKIHWVTFCATNKLYKKDRNFGAEAFCDTFHETLIYSTYKYAVKIIVVCSTRLKIQVELGMITCCECVLNQLGCTSLMKCTDP